LVAVAFLLRVLHQHEMLNTAHSWSHLKWEWLLFFSCYHSAQAWGAFALITRRMFAFNFELTRILLLVGMELAAYAALSEDYIFMWYRTTSMDLSGDIVGVRGLLRAFRGFHVCSGLWLGMRFIFFPFYGHDAGGRPLFLPGQQPGDWSRSTAIVMSKARNSLASSAVGAAATRDSGSVANRTVKSASGLVANVEAVDRLKAQLIEARRAAAAERARAEKLEQRFAQLETDKRGKAEAGSSNLTAHSRKMGKPGVTERGLATPLLPTPAKGEFPLARTRSTHGLFLAHQLFMLQAGITMVWITGEKNSVWMPSAMYVLLGAGLWTSHWVGHRRWFCKRWFQFHTMGHHVRDYPPSRFLVDNYIAHNNKDDRLTPWHLEYWVDMNAVMYVPWIPATIALIHASMCCAVDGSAGLVRSQVLCLGIMGLGVAMSQNYWHEQVHLRGSVWEGFQWFQDIRRLHWQHHKGNCRHNYAMIDFGLDILTGNLLNTAS
jgi:hypothetical protein